MGPPQGCGGWLSVRGGGWAALDCKGGCGWGGSALAQACDACTNAMAALDYESVLTCAVEVLVVIGRILQVVGNPEALHRRGTWPAL